jgi:hypothetical protein
VRSEQSPRSNLIIFRKKEIECCGKDTPMGRGKLADGSMLAVDEQLAGTPSVLFNAVAAILSDVGTKRCRWSPRVLRSTKSPAPAGRSARAGHGAFASIAGLENYLLAHRRDYFLSSSSTPVIAASAAEHKDQQYDQDD